MFRYANRVFDEPQAVFNERMLKPELQDLESFVDGINNIVEAQQRVALNYIKDGSIEFAIPPLKILLNIMAYGHYEGKNISDPELRKHFNRDNVLKTDWYNNRLKYKQEVDIKYYERQIKYINNFINDPHNTIIANQLKLSKKVKKAKKKLLYISSEKYLNNLIGTIGADNLLKK